MTKKSTEHRASTLKTLGQVIPFFKPYSLRILLAFIVLSIAAAAILALPWTVRQIIDQRFFIHQEDKLNHYLVVLLVLVSVVAIFSAARFYLVMWLGERIVADIRKKTYQNIIRMDPLFFEVTRTGEVISRLTTDTTLVQAVVGAGISIALRSFFMLAGSLIMLFITSPRLTLLILVVVPVVILPLVYFGRKVRKLSRATQEHVAETSAIAGETINSVPMVQSYVLEAFYSGRYADSAEASFNIARKRLKARALLTAFAIFILFNALMLMIWVGAQWVLDDQLTIGELSQFLFYAIFVATSTAALSEVWGEIQRAAGAMERLLELMDAKPAIRSPDHPIMVTHASTERIRFNRVGFQYPSRGDEQALTEFDLNIAPGETVALVGPSGAGKSTVFQLLLRFYDPTKGMISLGGVDISKMDIHQLRNQIGIVPQETVIFAADVMENIRYGRLDAGNEEIVKAAKAAAADEFIQWLPNGYHSFLGERGIRLSVGQRQRIAIARAILKNAPILLLDEATSALDAESEKLVQEALYQLMKNRTTLVIAHRLATVLKADRIIVMEQGKIVATGTHEELLQHGGLYSRLAALQFSDSQLPK